MGATVPGLGVFLLLQRATNIFDGSFESTGTARVALSATSRPYLALYARARAGNSGTVQIGSLTGTGGPFLASGEWFPVVGPGFDLQYVGVQFSQAGDFLDFMGLA